MKVNLAKLGKTGYKSTPAIKNPGKRVGRNDPCPCGSGKKYKACCIKEMPEIYQRKGLGLSPEALREVPVPVQVSPQAP